MLYAATIAEIQTQGHLRIPYCLLPTAYRLPAMLDPSHPLARLLKQDPRYKIDAYVFVQEALSYAHDALGMGSERPSDEPEEPLLRSQRSTERAPERHLTGQELCEAIRHYALEEYGYLAKSVLNSWGIAHDWRFREYRFQSHRVEANEEGQTGSPRGFRRRLRFRRGLLPRFPNHDRGEA